MLDDGTASGSRGRSTVIPRPGFAQDRRLRSVRMARERGQAIGGKNIPLLFEVTEELDVAAVEEATRRLVTRHGALRHRFAHHDGVTVLRPVEAGILCTTVDGDALSSTQDVLQHVRALVDRPFDLMDWPLLRLGVVRLAGRSLCYLSVDHLVTDGWSQSVLAAELPALYREVVSERRAKLPQAGNYLAFTAEQRDRFASGPELGNRVAALRRTLRGRPVQPRFPLAVSGWDSNHGRYTKLRMLDADLVQPFVDRCKAARATPFVGVLASVGAAMRAAGGGDTAGVLFATHNREAAENHTGVGWYANMLPLYFRGGNGFKETVRNARAALMTVIEHHELPLALLLDHLPDGHDGEAGVKCSTFFVSFADDRATAQHDRHEPWQRVFLQPTYRSGYGLWFSLHHGGLDVWTASPRPGCEHVLAEFESEIAHALRAAATGTWSDG